MKAVWGQEVNAVTNAMRFDCHKKAPGRQRQLNLMRPFCVETEMGEVMSCSFRLFPSSLVFPPITGILDDTHLHQYKIQKSSLDFRRVDDAEQFLGEAGRAKLIYLNHLRTFN